MNENDFSDGGIATKTKSTTPTTSQYKVNLVSDNIGTKVFPNPFDDNLNLSIDCKANCNYTVSVNDVVGKILWTKDINSTERTNTINIDIANQLSQGVYFVHITNSDGKKSVHCVIKQ